MTTKTRRLDRRAVSPLVDAHPTRFDLVAGYLGDTADSVRKYYAWLDEEKSREEIQARPHTLAQNGEIIR